MKILVLQSHRGSGPAYLEESAAAHGAELIVCMPNLEAEHSLPDDDGGYDGFMLMGGEMNAGDVAEHPWLEQAAELVRRFTANDKPVLGICLGSQIVARAFGARLYDCPDSEVGYYELRLTEAAAGDALLGNGIPNPVQLAEFHKQTFDLPDGATLLMTGNGCRHQAFRIGAASYSFQPHFEVTPAQVTKWVAAMPDWVARAAPDLPAQLPDLLARHDATGHAFSNAVGGAWFELAARRARRGA